jgi:hypothetical protein
MSNEFILLGFNTLQQKWVLPVFTLRSYNWQQIASRHCTTKIMGVVQDICQLLAPR